MFKGRALRIGKVPSLGERSGAEAVKPPLFLFTLRISLWALDYLQYTRWTHDGYDTMFIVLFIDFPC